jgi:hypothetical protein
MSTGRPCEICRSADRMKLVAQMVAEGVSDQKIADRLGGGLNRMAVSRHRRNHVEAPAKAIAQAAAKGRDVVEQRAQTLAAAEAGDPAAFVALASIVEDLRKVHDRLERTAGAAEQDNQRLAVASLAGQQTRVAEVRAKLGGIGGYAAQKTPSGDGQQFTVVFNLGGGRIDTLAFTPQREARVVDAVPVDAPDGEDEPDDMAPAFAKLSRAFGAMR